MLGRQKQVLEAFARASDFLKRNPAEQGLAIGRLYAGFMEMTERVLRAAAHQDLGHRLSRAATAELHASVRRLRERHLKPIAMIARASMDPEVMLEMACALPKKRLPVTILEAEARAMRDAAGKHEAWFVAMGRDPRFLAQLEAAIADIKEKQLKRERATSLHVGATAALVMHLSQARKLLEILDCHVRETFVEDGAKLAEWHVARRVQLKPGGRRAAPVVEAPTMVEVPPALTLSNAA